MIVPRLVAASAPGKLVLMGEYAVLRGHEAVVAAVDVRAVARRSSGTDGLRFDPDAGGLLQACVDELAAAGRHPRGALAVDTAAFRDGDDNKLGLGSSAAACVAALRVLLAHVDGADGADGVDGVDGGDAGFDRAAFHRLAQRAHRRFQRGRGSGIDVAASTWGGLVRFWRDVAGDGGADVDDAVHVGAAPGIPRSLVVLPVWTGRAQDTRDFIGAALAHRGFNDLVAPLGAATARFVAGCGSGDGGDVLGAVDDARRGLAALGARVGIDVVSAPHAQVAALTADHGGAAKPSGAGGGDVALAFVPVERAAALRQSLADAGLPTLPLVLGDVDGVRLTTEPARPTGEA